jgi:hypothetical protein
VGPGLLGAVLDYAIDGQVVYESTSFGEGGFQAQRTLYCCLREFRITAVAFARMPGYTPALQNHYFFARASDELFGT